MNEVAARDTRFDNVIPKSLWISTRTTEDRKYIKVYVEVNGIEKEIDSIYVGQYDGILSHSHQLSWIIHKATDEFKLALKEMSEALDKAIVAITLEYCSHNGTCTSDRETCYAKDYIKVLDKHADILKE